MFTVTPVTETAVSESPESRARRVSFSPDVDDNYRMNVIDKIKGLIDEVETIHRREERQLQKSLEAEKWAFKQKQEKELQDFLKRQKMEASSFECYQNESRNNLRENQQRETLRLFGTTRTSPAGQGGWTNENGWQNPNNNNSESNNQRQTVIGFWNQQ